MSAIDKPITIHQPKRLEVGAGASARLGSWAAGVERSLVIADQHTASYADALELPGNVTIFADVTPEPDTSVLERAIAFARECQPDLIVGLGGGSVMDIAKLVAALWDGEQALKDVVGPNRVQRRRTLLAQVATTAGTGSEAGIRALVTDPDSKSKIAVESPYLLADFAILDPVLTYSVPPAVTAANGIDAMAHCVEAFTNINAHDLIDGYARMGMSLIGKYLPRAVADGQDTEARTGMMLASYYGGICLGPVNTAAGHALAYPLGTRLSLPHGLSNAIIFPHVLAFNESVHSEKTREIAGALGLHFNGSAGSLFDSAYAFCRDLGVEMQLAKHGAQEEDLSTWAEEAHGIRRLMDNNPRDMTVDDVLTIYRAAL